MSAGAVTRSVLVVEDDALFRELVAVALEGQGFEVDTAATAADAKRVFVHGEHDALLIDVNLGPGASGIDLARVLRELEPHVAVVFLTHLPDPRFAGDSLDGRLRGAAFLNKGGMQDVEELVAVIDAALRGMPHPRNRQDLDPDRPLAGLSRKQIEVMGLLAQGLTNAQIAETRGVSVKAVEVTITRAAAACGIDAETEGNVRVALARRYLTATRGEVDSGRRPVQGS